MVTGQADIVRVAEEYFAKIFKLELLNVEAEMEDNLDVIPELITDDMKRELMQPYTREEIRRAVFQMAQTKAPGVDGFPALFSKDIGTWWGTVCVRKG
ncbi:hypothetical protein QQ045_010816 [Rhodiola kirilowii]